MLVAARNSLFSVAYVKVGLTPDGGATAFLAEFVSRQVLTELCLTGERISGERMHALGPVNRLAEPGQALADAVALADRDRPDQAMALIKDLCRQAPRNTLEQQLELEAQHMVRSQGSEESREGIAAFLEKRSADFQIACLSARNQDFPRRQGRWPTAIPNRTRTSTSRWRVKVLDLSRVFAGPLCGMVLADFGAEVVKVEHPGRGDDTRDWGMRIGKTETTYYNSMNRNKRSITLDLQTPEGVKILHELLPQFDVVIHNFKTGGAEKLGWATSSSRPSSPT
jgi:hypothetical protein